MKDEIVQALTTAGIRTTWTASLNAVRYRNGYIWTVGTQTVDITHDDMLSFRKVQAALFKGSNGTFLLPGFVAREWGGFIMVLAKSADYHEKAEQLPRLPDLAQEIQEAMEQWLASVMSLDSKAREWQDGYASHIDAAKDIRTYEFTALTDGRIVFSLVRFMAREEFRTLVSDKPRPADVGGALRLLGYEYVRQNYARYWISPPGMTGWIVGGEGPSAGGEA